MLSDIVKGKNVLFITTHRIDYIRITQELEILNEHAKSVDVLYGKRGKHILSLLKILPRLWFSSLKKYDVVVVSYMCQMIVPFVNYKFKNKTLVVDFFISLYDSLVFDRQKFGENHIAAKLVHSLDEKSLKNADLIIADTRAHASYFVDEFHLTEKEIEVLYLQADKSIYYPREVKRPEAWKDKVLVLYFGTVIPLQGIDIILEAMRQLKDIPYIHFLVIGPVSSVYETADISNAEFINWLPQNELADYIAMSDICLAGHFCDYIQKANRTIPGKVYIYEAMDKIMILGDSDANRESYVEDEKHLYVKRGDAMALKDKILEEANIICQRKSL